MASRHERAIRLRRGQKLWRIEHLQAARLDRIETNFSVRISSFRYPWKFISDYLTADCFRGTVLARTARSDSNHRGIASSRFFTQFDCSSAGQSKIIDH